jgi:hypothetical protein
MAGDDEVNEHGEAGLAPTAMMEVATDDDRPKEGGVSDNEQVFYGFHFSVSIIVGLAYTCVHGCKVEGRLFVLSSPT